jgi:hypothetical protein
MEKCIDGELRLPRAVVVRFPRMRILGPASQFARYYI